MHFISNRSAGRILSDHGVYYSRIDYQGTEDSKRPFSKYFRSFLPFCSSVLEQAGNSSDPHVVLFIHGFNVEEYQAAESATVVEDIVKPIGAGVVGFSWSSAGKAHKYVSDRMRARSSAITLAIQLIKAVQHMQRTDCNVRLSVIAHSMGNYVLGKAASYLREELGIENYSMFSEVLMVAPDLEGEALSPGGAAYDLTKISQEITVYRNIHDIPLKISRVKRGVVNGPVLGRNGVNKRLIEELPDNVVVVDTSHLGVRGVDTHSFYFDNSYVISDMLDVLRGTDRGFILGRVRVSDSQFEVGDGVRLEDL